MRNSTPVLRGLDTIEIFFKECVTQCCTKASDICLQALYVEMGVGFVSERKQRPYLLFHLTDDARVSLLFRSPHV